MAFKKMIADIMPPAVMRVAQRLNRRRRGLGWHVYYGAWPTLADVSATEGDPWAETPGGIASSVPHSRARHADRRTDLCAL